MRSNMEDAFISLPGAARVLHDNRLLRTAHRLASDAIERLSENGMFQGYPNGHVYESVDGVGFLCLALISLDVEDDLESYGLNL